MKRYWVYLLLTVSLMVNVGVLAGAGLQVWRAQGTTELAFFGMGHERVADYLKLDGKQREHWHTMEQDFVKNLNDVGSEIQIHRERLVHEVFATQPEASVIERERTAIFTLQEAQQRSVIEQLLKERDMLNPQQRRALADLLLKQDPSSTAGRK